MKTFKGTKGEWHTLEENRVIYIQNKDKVLIAELDNYETIGFNQTRPTDLYFNAKLIAAAPELLKALQSVKKAFENKVIDSTNGKDALAGALIFIIDKTIDKALD